MKLETIQIENLQKGVRRRLTIPLSLQGEIGERGWSIGGLGSGADIEIDEPINCDFLAICRSSHHLVLIGRHKGDSGHPFPQTSILVRENGRDRWFVAYPFEGQRIRRGLGYRELESEVARLNKVIDTATTQGKEDHIFYKGRRFSLEWLVSIREEFLQRTKVAQEALNFPMNEIYVRSDGRPLRIGEHQIALPDSDAGSGSEEKEHRKGFMRRFRDKAAQIFTKTSRRGYSRSR